MPVPRPEKGESRQDFVNRCEASSSMEKDFPDQQQRLAVCYEAWDRRNKKKKKAKANVRGTLVGQLDGSQVRKEEFLGTEYLVAPVVAMVEGVRFGANASGGELGLAEEFGKFPGGWNNRPVVMNHPQEDGHYVSANEPKLLEKYSFGFTANTMLDGKKLKMEAWLNPQRADDVDGAQDVLDRIDKGEVIEVSVGFFTDLEEKSGSFTVNGVSKNYTGIWRNVVPDHLAFLEEGTLGACSIKDGCGAPRVNKIAVTVEDNEHCCDACKEGKECINPQAKRKGEDPNDPEAAKKTARKVIKGYEGKSPEEVEALRAHELVAQSIADGVMDSDVRRGLSKALNEEKANDGYIYLMGFTQTHAVYESINYNDPSSSWKILQRPFNIDSDGRVKFTGDPVEVNLVTKVVVRSESEVKPQKDNDMTTQSTGTAPAATQTDEEKAELEAQAKADAEKKAKEEEEAKKAKMQEQPATQAAKPLSVQQYIEQAPAEMQEVLKSGLRMHQEKKDGLIKALQATGRCKFSEDYLKAQSLETLENLAVLSEVPTFAGRAGETLATQSRSGSDNAPPVAPLAFPVKAA